MTAHTAREQGDAIMHPGAIIFVRACKSCTFYGPDRGDWSVCPDCGYDESWRVEAAVHRVR